MSDVALHRKFGRVCRIARCDVLVRCDFEVESYLRYQGSSFVDGSMPTLSLSDAGDGYSISRRSMTACWGSVQETRTRSAGLIHQRLAIPTSESRESFTPQCRRCAGVVRGDRNDKGHDAFLLDVRNFSILRGHSRLRRGDPRLPRPDHNRSDHIKRDRNHECAGSGAGCSGGHVQASRP